MGDGGRMRLFNRVALAVCVLAAVGILVQGLFPFSEAPLQYEAPPGVEKVDCGSVFAPNDRWVLDEACLDANTGRTIGMVLLFFLAAPFALVAGALSLVRWFRSVGG